MLVINSELLQKPRGIYKLFNIADNRSVAYNRFRKFQGLLS